MSKDKGITLDKNLNQVAGPETIAENEKKMVAVGENVIVKSTRGKSSIFIPDEVKETHSQQKQLLKNTIEVVAIGDKVEGIKIGDRLIVSPLAPGIVISYKNIFGEDLPEELKYLIVKKDHILAIINK